MGNTNESEKKVKKHDDASLSVNKRIKDTNGNEMMLFVGTVNDLSNEKK